jgi:hypothetical protein
MDVTRIRIDSSVRAIQDEAYYNRSRLMIVIFNFGLEVIGESAFLN